MKNTKNSALETNLSFYYQTLIGLDRCFDLDEDGMIFFEKDGDVSFINKNSINNTQIEVKNYSDNLTDNHENFWKTLKNWMSDDFEHERYQFLMLCTTQPYGTRSSFKDWNSQNIKDRLNTIKNIIKKRQNKSLDTDIDKLQNEIMNKDKDKLKSVISKIVLYTNMENLEELENKIRKKIIHIVDEYVDFYLEGLIGFVYLSAKNQNEWSVTYHDFKEKNRELTRKYTGRIVTGNFTGSVATEQQIEENENKLFVSKIKDIKYEEVIPEAIGNYLEFINSVNKDLDRYSTLRTYTNNYRNSILLPRMNTFYRKAKRSNTHPQDFYDEMMNDQPVSLDDYSPHPIYKNGLIHEIMDDENENLKWDTES